MSSIKINATINEKKTFDFDDENADSEVLGKLLDRFYKCRDFELSHVWLRSVFLGAFLILIFSGYGYYFCKIYLEGKIHSLLNVHLIGFLISFIGCGFSIVWIYMAKASKKWYEVYENVITQLEDNAILAIPKRYRMGKYHAYNSSGDSIFSTEGGNYSPSRLNILIGQLSLIIFIFPGTFHLFEIFYKYGVIFVTTDNCGAYMLPFCVHLCLLARGLFAFIIILICTAALNYIIGRTAKSQSSIN